MRAHTMQTPVDVNGAEMWEVYDADGYRIALAINRFQAERIAASLNKSEVRP